MAATTGLVRCSGCGDHYPPASIHACCVTVQQPIRTFDSGATRDALGDKLAYEAFLSPRVLRRYAQYMHEHRKQADGTLRDGDNWQKGIPVKAYQDSLVRHVMDAWHEWRTNPFGGDNEKVKELLCAIIFNAMGYLHELLK